MLIEVVSSFNKFKDLNYLDIAIFMIIDNNPNNCISILKKDIAEIKKSNAELVEQVTLLNNKEKSWWESFSTDSNITGAQNVTFIGTIITGCTGVSLTTISIEGQDDPKPIVEAVLKYGKTDYVSVERDYNNCVSLEIWNKDERLHSESDA